jgi:DNA-binding transcriptional ArsR family regulator
MVFAPKESAKTMKEKQALRALAALSQSSRLRVFRLLVRHGVDGARAGDIARKLSVTPATLSFHLRELETAELIESQREGRWIRYAVRPAGVRELLTFLTDQCCQGRPELCLPAANKACPCDEADGKSIPAAKRRSRKPREVGA